MTDRERRYEIEPAPDPASRAAIEAALELLAADSAASATSVWERSARREVVDDGLA